MECKIYRSEDQKTSRWTGGKTTQLAIYPQDGDYLERRFVWRLSSATCELDESAFSKLPDFDRTLIVLKGSVVLAHEGVRVVRLAELEQDSFDGGYRTKSFGKITDYNLMVRKGNKGSARVIPLVSESTKLEYDDCGRYQMGTQAIFVREGFATVSIDKETLMVQAGEQLVINYDRRERPYIRIMGEGTAVHCSIYYNYEQGQMGPTVIESKPATLADFRECVFIANTQYRFSKYTNKKLKRLWYDEELQDGIRKINRFYLADLAYCLEVLLLIALCAAVHLRGVEWVIALCLVTLLHLLLISPLMYFLVVPKPVAAHMKDIDKLTPYEQERRAYELGRNERVEKILGRYKFSGTDTYDEDGNRTDDYRAKKW